jgi:hypothetical protein
MHGGATAIFAILAQTLTERHLKMNPLLYLPGLLAAIILHSIFNHFPVSPVLSTAVTLLILPTLLFMLFERNTVSIHNYLEVDFDSHKRLLRQIEHGEFTGCEAGRFLLDLKRVVTGSVAQDMVYYFHLHTELVLSAEQLLLAREQGIKVSIDKEIRNYGKSTCSTTSPTTTIDPYRNSSISLRFIYAIRPPKVRATNSCMDAISLKCSPPS